MQPLELAFSPTAGLIPRETLMPSSTFAAAKSSHFTPFWCLAVLPGQETSLVLKFGGMHLDCGRGWHVQLSPDEGS